MITEWVIVAVLLVAYVQSFYLPGVAPHEFQNGDDVEIKAVKLTSVLKPLPYDYYHLPFCRPEKLKRSSENLGEVLRGDRIVNTPYKLKMNENVQCRVTCNSVHDKAIVKGLKAYDKHAVKKFSDFVRKRYRAHLLLDNLPSAGVVTVDNSEQYVRGFQIGDEDKNGDVIVYNHIHVVVKVNSNVDNSWRVVGFEVRPKSIDKGFYTVFEDGSCKIKNDTKILPAILSLKEDTKRSVLWSYSAAFEISTIAWATRWDPYLVMGDAEIHWFSIGNSLCVVLILSGLFAGIIIRTLRRDIVAYNMADEDDIEPSGWKMLHGDVFRGPVQPLLFVTFVGTGIQLLSMCVITLIFGIIGILSPASGGALTTVFFLTYLSMGIFSGYYGGRFFRTFTDLTSVRSASSSNVEAGLTRLDDVSWVKIGLYIALFFPSLVLGVGFCLNFFIWGNGSSGAVPFTTMIALLLLWFGVAVPVVLAGAFFGSRKGPYTPPVAVTLIPRQIPQQSVWYLRPVVAMLLGGGLPFSALFIELHFILSAIWDNQYYYLFGFLVLVFSIMVVVCAEIAIVVTYTNLCVEDHRWWWSSFRVGGGVAIYVLLYSVFYFFLKLHISGFTSILLYFSYSLLMAFALFLLCGTIGFCATFIFLRRIYAAVKID